MHLKKPNAQPALYRPVIAVAHEAVAGQGEDSLAYRLRDKDGFLSVLDGCGGLGSRRYPELGGRTGASLAAQAAAEAGQAWFSGKPHYRLKAANALDQAARTYQETLRAHLARLDAQTVGERVAITGSMVRRFPTTCATILFDASAADKLKCAYLWAGDSRGYLLETRGLQQVTRDDLKGEPDALENLFADSQLSNVASAQGDFTVHLRPLTVTAPCLLVAATDGAFGYWPTPMHFEYLLLDTLCMARSEDAWEKLLLERLLPVAGDDFTLLLTPFGFADFKAMRAAMKPRRDVLRAQYIRPIDRLGELTAAKLMPLWAQYKPSYEGTEVGPEHE